MELPSQHQKAPLVKVFQLYCVDALSAAQVARKCACSRSLVMLRLQQLRKKTGCDPARLRVRCHGAAEPPEN
jgi:DNA-directed RNA polymerase specialized sigma24 family protein